MYVCMYLTLKINKPSANEALVLYSIFTRLWHFVLVPIFPVAFCLGGILSGGILSGHRRIKSGVLVSASFQIFAFSALLFVAAFLLFVFYMLLILSE